LVSVLGAKPRGVLYVRAYMRISITEASEWASPETVVILVERE
jgi:hypothetical protein